MQINEKAVSIIPILSQCMCACDCPRCLKKVPWNVHKPITEKVLQASVRWSDLKKRMRKTTYQHSNITYSYRHFSWNEAARSISTFPNPSCDVSSSQSHPSPAPALHSSSALMYRIELKYRSSIYLVLHIWQGYLTFPYYFIFDRISRVCFGDLLPMRTLCDSYPT